MKKEEKKKNIKINETYQTFFIAILLGSARSDTRDY